MASYTTLDYLPDLSLTQRNTADPLVFVPDTGADNVWEYEAGYFGSTSYEWLYSVKSFYGREGATYDIGSQSIFDPYYIRLYDSSGNAIAVNQPDTEYGTDFLTEFVAPYTGTYYVDAGWNQGTYYTSVALLVLEDRDTVPSFVFGGTNGRDVISAKSGNDTLNGLGGNDTLAGWLGNDVINGGDGIDTAQYAGLEASNAWTKTSTGYTVLDLANGDVDALTGIERLRFLDKNIALDIDGNAGQAYRMYQAAFDRIPDLPGLGAQINGMDNGLSILQIGQNFMDSSEFALRYGMNLSNADFVTQLYANVLDRTPDPGGYAHQLNAIDSGAVSRAQLLVNFSESVENKANVIGVIQGGIEYIPFG
jgi:serralysin